MSSDLYRKSVVEALYSTPTAMGVGALAGAVVATLCAWQTGDPVFLAFGSLILLFFLGRILAARNLLVSDQFVEGGDQPLRATDRAYSLAVLQGTLATTSLGAMAFYAIHVDGSSFAELSTLAVALANAVGVAGRSFGSRLLVRLQIATLCLPLSFALLLDGSTASTILAVLPLLLAFATIDIASGQRLTLTQAIEARTRSEKLSHLLAITLETTPNGILMLDRDARLRFANAQACRVLGLTPQDGPQEGGAGLDRSQLEEKIEAVLVPSVRDTQTGLGVGPKSARRAAHRQQDGRQDGQQNLRGEGAREFTCRIDDTNVYRFTERTNEAGETVIRIDDITVLSEAENRIVHLARFDGLTGLANRGWFFERAQSMLDAGRVGDVVMVAVLDLNGLKRINDTYGHAAGDAAIQKAATRLSEAIGEAGLCVRLGGDEFAVLATMSGPHAAQTIEALATQMETSLDFVLETPRAQLNVRGSVGTYIRVLDPRSGPLDLDELLERADYAQYVAKTTEGTYSCRFEQAMEDELERHKSLREDLAGAIETGEISTAYQPIFSAARNGIVCFEALARWSHPRFGSVRPDEFIALAEETGQIRALTRFQLRAATRFARTLPDHVKVSVNASAQDFSSGTIVGDVREALAESGLAAARLVVEMTETSLLHLGPSVFDTLDTVRRSGVRVALDDFGTGYSSLSYMQKLQFDTLKVDRAFLETLHEGERTVSVLRAVRQLAEGLDMAVVIEGVETERQLDVLTRELGFEFFQGYFFSRPLPAADARELACRTAAGNAAESVDRTEQAAA